MEEFLITCNENVLQAVRHRPANKDANRVIIMCHGFRGSKDGGGRAVAVADTIAEAGFSVIRFNFTPLQKLTRQIEEIAAVVQYCHKHISKEIILLGRSMGGSAAIAYASKYQHVQGLCLWATPWNLMETFKLALGDGYALLEKGQTLSVHDAYGELELTPDFIEDFKNFNLLESLVKFQHIPVLILHGTKDEIVPFIQAERIYQTLSEPKRLEVFEGGDHHLSMQSTQAATAIRHWLDQYFSR
ncbi:prolyl oligopeptidase family serine peptidase [bacterium BFN5]|nr:prolyl oligopeptidase family serine peptidase [bacterium BFN5]